MKLKNQLFISLAGLALSLSCTHAQITIFQEDFNGGTGDLNGASPDTGGVNWVAASMFDLNGDVNETDAGAGSATLAFAPVNGFTYTAEASYTLSAGGSGDFIGFGFANGQDATVSTGNRFLGALTSGRAWAFTRENTNNPAASLTETTNSATWTGLTNSPSNVDLRIILDTTGGTGAWTATWFAKDQASVGYTEVRASTLLGGEDIDSVGFASAGGGVTANITNFSLTSIPEPSSYAFLAGLTGLALVMTRRRRA